jgi:hypothetical protein
MGPSAACGGAVAAVVRSLSASQRAQGSPPPALRRVGAGGAFRALVRAPGSPRSERQRCRAARTGARASLDPASLNCTTGCVSQNACRRCSASRRRTTCLGDGSAWARSAQRPSAARGRVCAAQDSRVFARRGAIAPPSAAPLVITSRCSASWISGLGAAAAAAASEAGAPSPDMVPCAAPLASTQQRGTRSRGAAVCAAAARRRAAGPGGGASWQQAGKRTLCRSPMHTPPPLRRRDGCAPYGA